MYAVGGCVRDQLLGRNVHEYDLTTNARPEMTRRLLNALQPQALYAVGEKFGTLGAIFDGVRIEITTYRGEWYTPGSRKPEVDFGDHLSDDLARRDFTINAIAANIETRELVDPYHGLEDIEAQVVRAVGNPVERFRDDPLRLLRAVRFASTLDFRVEESTAEAARQASGSLVNVSRERIRDEMTRMVEGPAPDRALQQLANLGLLHYIVPELLELRRVESGGGRHKDIFRHTLIVTRQVESKPKDRLVTRWAAILHDIAKPRTLVIRDGDVSFLGHEKLGAEMATAILRGLRYDQPTIRSVARVVSMHTHANSYTDEWTDGAVRRLVREAGDDLDPLLNLSKADVTSRHEFRKREAAERVEKLRERIHRLEEEASIKALRPPLDGNDLVRMFDRPPGPWIKPIKDRLLEMVIEGELAQDDRESGERIAHDLYQELDDASHTEQ